MHKKHVHGNRPGAFQGRASRLYNFVATTVLRRLYRRLAQDVAAAAPQNASVLDIGTGPGVLLVELARLRPDLQLTGVDLSPDMIAAANRNLAPYAGQVNAQVADVTKLPFEDSSFDLIVSSLSLHHWDDPESAAPELARVLRPGGRVHIYDFRFAPFEKLAGATQTRSVSTPFRTGVPFFPRCIRWVMS